MRILVTGASGMLGSSLAVELNKNHDVFATGRTQIDLPVNYKAFDLSVDAFKELIDWSDPDLIILCGALTNGNYCKEHIMEAFKVNGFSVKKFLDATNEKTRLIYISTDAVFPSELHLAKENDCTVPESIYGKSKELGEFFLLNSKRDYLIIRTTIVGLNLYSDNKGFVEWIVNASKSNENIGLFDDVNFNPISIWELIDEINFLIMQKNFDSQVLHITGREYTTKYKFCLELLKALSLNQSMVDKAYISNFKDRAKRSNDQTLSTELYEGLYKRQLPTINDTINTIKARYNAIN